MTQSYSNDQWQLLVADCHKLVDQISKRPGSIKLLGGAKEALEVYVQYKAVRARSLRQHGGG